MSNLVVEVCEIENIRPHNNADLLEIADVGGYQCVVLKGMYQPGSRVVYFPINTMLPRHWSDQFGVSQHLSFTKDAEKGRVRCARLRGEPSFGILMPANPDWPVGYDASAYYDCEKYVPPVKLSGGQSVSQHPFFFKYTNIENLRHYRDVLIPGEPVVITEKFHGMNCRVGVIEGEFLAGSHDYQRAEPEDYSMNRFWFPLSLKPVKDLLNKLKDIHKQVILFGEILGPSIQKFHYNQKRPIFMVFDIMIDGKYLDWQDFQELCDDNDVPMVSVLNIGGYSLDIVKKLACGQSTLGGNFREGVVVRPLTERTHPAIGRVILKYHSDDFLLRTIDDDSTDA